MSENRILYIKVIRKRIVLALTAFFVLLLSSCVTSRQVNYLQKPSVVIPSYADTVKYTDYRLMKGDYLHIKVYSFNEVDLSLYNCSQYVTEGIGDNAASRLCLFVIDDEGYVDYPYIGRFYALGKTTRQLKFDLEELFRKEVAKYLSVDVYLANRSFSIIGEAKRSARIDLPHEKITIFQALAMAGDLNTYADKSRVKLVRNTNDGTIVKEFDLRSEKIVDSEFYYIQPNDVIYVQPSIAKNVGVTHISNAISVTLSATSFGIMIYNLVNRFVKK